MELKYKALSFTQADATIEKKLQSSFIRKKLKKLLENEKITHALGKEGLTS